MKRKNLIVLIGTLLLFVLAFTSASAQGGLLTETTARINLRAGGGTEWRVITVVEAGTPILLDGQAFGGAWARGIVPDGSVGWVLTNFLTAPRDQIATLPGIWVDAPFTLSPPAPNAAVPPPPLPEEPAAEPVEQPAQDGPVVTTNRVNVRGGAGTNFAILTTVNPNTPLQPNGRNLDGSWVRGTLPDGTVGYIFAQFLSISPGAIAALPPVEGGASVPQSAAQPGANPGAVANAPVAPLVNTSPVRGFSYGAHIAGLDSGAINRMRQAGMTWVKQQFRYQDGQDPSAVAGMINGAHANGFRVLVAVVGLPGQVNAPGYFDRYANFVGGVAALGADAIEVWNEPNIDREWPAGSIDPARFTELLRVSSSAIRAANPNTLIISGAPAPTGFFGGCSPNGCDDNAFIAGMAAAGAANFIDCVGIHYNEGIVPPTARSGDPRGNSTHYTRYLPTMISTYNSAFGGRRPLCFTELGYLTPEGLGPLPPAFAWAQNVTLAQQASWIDQAVSITSRSNVRLTILWNMNFTNYGADPMAGYALIRPDGSCPACDALAS
ncbi:MAG: hypothetical protein D6737_07945 [Chloroflexi bacterium]|nr:MAG: hypothetical protein D6737_07945 [Chloroflexota bacterium]